MKRPNTGYGTGVIRYDDDDEFNQTLCVGFIDYEKAFDSIES